MTSSDETITGLKEALKFSPDNVPLRILLADALVGLGRFDEAENEYSRALTIAPTDEKVMLGLATVWFQAGKYSQSLVLAEDLAKRSPADGRAMILLARLMLNEGKVQQAVQYYKRAVQADPSSADGNLAEKLGIGADLNAAVIDGKVRSVEHSDDVSPASDLLEISEITFVDVGGMEDVKEQVRLKLIYPMMHADTYKAYGKKIGGGILLYGPPGCGKTYLARATAGEVKSRFMIVGLHDVLDMWIGSSERNLHEIFEVARANSPCVLFFDEVDALAASRSDMKTAGGRHVINQFLNELDGVEAKNDGLLILAATNAPWHVDPAFRRPGRFDRIIFVPPPDAQARAACLRVMLKGKPIENIDFEHLAKKTERFSGADIKAMIDQAIEEKIQNAMREGVPKPLTTKDLEKAAKSVKPSTAEWFATARNYALYANESGLYDDILKYLKI
ncbi:MAG: AAA family ATPase [Cyanobacteria bacterium]|nr:AAA family ATPase [Cyanobacteriota bacterium]